jgi:hypothetical protein
MSLQRSLEEPQQLHAVGSAAFARAQTSKLKKRRDKHGDVLLNDAILQQVLLYVGSQQYLFSASISKSAGRCSLH